MEKDVEQKKEYKMTHSECGCKREDFIDSLFYLPDEYINELLRKGIVEAECENCGKQYVVEKEELEKIFKDVKKRLEYGSSLCETCFLSDDCSKTDEEKCK